MRNLLNKISQKVGLTLTEIKTFIFVLIIFTAGLILNNIDIQFEEITEKKFDYSYHDSLFKALENGERKKILRFENEEKKVDSDLELSDFSNAELDSKKKNKTKLVNFSINLNEADLETLVKLPGIGPKTAEKIITYRTQKGGFKRINELTEIKGIGSKKLENIKNFLIIE